MFSKNFNHIPFDHKVKKKNQIYLKKLLNFNNLLKNYPLLKSFGKNYNYSFNKIKIKKLKKFNTINIIGIGGSILGTKAIFSFLKNKIRKNIFFYDNLNYDKIEKSNKKCLNIIVSKSGNTIETIINFNLISKNKKNNKNIFITETSNNILKNLGNKLKSDIIEHKNFIGGRYSVLSEVGMIPSELVGFKTEKFKKLNQLIKNKNFLNNLITNVSAIYNYTKIGKTNSIILNYDERSDDFFRWYQQLTAESLGKDGKGILPLISTMPKDNHSLLQLYLDGPKNTFFTFFNVDEKNTEKFNSSILINKYSGNSIKTLNNIINIKNKAAQIVFKQKKIPFRSFQIFKRNEETIGELFCFFVLETILLAELLKINAFDQPAVELVKLQTKKLLIN